jgi:DNA-directed RNA polymerase subunit RPC12/RpoP
MSNLRSINGNGHNRHNGQHSTNRQKATINIEETELVCCECGSETYLPAIRIGELSAAHPKNPSGYPQHLPFSTYVCAQCGTEIDSDL